MVMEEFTKNCRSTVPGKINADELVISAEKESLFIEMFLTWNKALQKHG